MSAPPGRFVSGALTSLVMTVPLIAVPCLAVFGLPSLGSSTAQADAEPSVVLADAPPHRPHDHADHLGEPHPEPPGAATADDDPFGRIVDAAPQTGFADRSGFDPTSDRRAAAANTAAGLDAPSPPLEPAVRTAAADPWAELSAPPQEATPTPPSTWGAAVERLKALGISEFRLLAGAGAGESHFSCAASEADGVTRRFEAEAADPLAAVADVLAQIERRQAGR